MSIGSLTVVGVGIQLAGDLTLAAKAWIEQADLVLYAVADAATASWLCTLNANAQPLPPASGFQRRRDLHAAMVEAILAALQRGLRLCVVFYGHPGVFVGPAHEAIRRARADGFAARMLPGVSAEDWLFADLGVDPAQHGCQSFEATDFLIRRRKFDPTSSLILWQIAVIGQLGFDPHGGTGAGLALLAEVLQTVYPPAHEVIVYEAAAYPTCAPLIERTPLVNLPTRPVTDRSTLYVPPSAPAPLDPVMAQRLGLSLHTYPAINSKTVVSHLPGRGQR